MLSVVERVAQYFMIMRAGKIVWQSAASAVVSTLEDIYLDKIGKGKGSAHAIAIYNPRAAGTARPKPLDEPGDLGAGCHRDMNGSSQDTSGGSCSPADSASWSGFVVAAAGSASESLASATSLSGLTGAAHPQRHAGDTFHARFLVRSGAQWFVLFLPCIRA
jgi:hypothetical protein